MKQADPGYRYEFNPDELQPIKACNEAHGFAVVKALLTRDYVEELKDSVRTVANPNNDLGPGQSRTVHAFIEYSPPLWKLLEHERYLKLCQHLVGSEEITVHRSAAIIRNPGSRGADWHTDWSFCEGPSRTANEVMNRGEIPSGLWFYLNGTHPSRGGLAVIADSHRSDWPGPEGFTFTEDRRSFHRQGAPPKAYAGMDVPGIVPLCTEPGDLILFAARTYHAAFPHGGTEPRLSCAVGFRAGRSPYPVPWPLPDSAKRFKESVPERLRPFVEYYTGFDKNWTAKATTLQTHSS